jgi:ABC-type branched-subunit amino acid transport system ATPase component
MATLALKVSDRAYVLRRGRLVLEGSSADLLAGGPEGTLVANYL